MFNPAHIDKPKDKLVILELMDSLNLTNITSLYFILSHYMLSYPFFYNHFVLAMYICPLARDTFSRLTRIVCNSLSTAHFSF